MMAQSQNHQTSDPFAFLNTQAPSTPVQPKEFHEVKADKPLADFVEFPHVNLASANIPSESINLDLLTQDSLSVFGNGNFSTENNSKKKIQPAFFWSIDELDSLIENLKAKSVQHAQFLSLKQQYENETQQLYNTLWSFPVHQREGREMCGDTNMVAYTYPVRTAQFNDNVSSILARKFEELNRFNTAPVFSSLFEQTLAESQFTQYIQSFLPQNGQADFSILTKVIDSIFALMKVHTETPLSNHTQALLRQLVLIMGTFLLQKKSEENLQKNAEPSLAHSNALINLEDMPTVAQTQTMDILGLFSENNNSQSAPTQTNNNQKLNIDNICIYFLVRLMDVDGCSWGAALLQPTITDVLYSKILHMLFVDKFDGRIHPETEYLAVLGQFPWSQLLTEVVKPDRSEDMKTLIIFPLQKGLEMAASKTYYKLMLALVKIISHLAPSYLSQTVAILMRSPWPSKLIFQPLLNSLRLDQADKQSISLIFGELYHLFNQRVADFSALTEDKRFGHRQQYLEYLVLNQHVLSNLYQIDSFVAQLNDIYHTQPVPPPNAANPSQAPPGNMVVPARCPLLTVLVNIAERAADVNEFDVPKVCIQELFYYAFVASTPPPPHPSQPVDQKKQHLTQSLISWLPYVKSEAAVQLARLLTIKPQLIGWLVHCIGQHLPVLNAEQVLAFLNSHSSMFSSWVIDIGSVNWISYFLTHRTLPQNYDTGSEQGGIVRIWIQTFLRSPPQVQFTQNAYVNGVTFGSRLIELIHWEKSEASVRSLVVLLLLAAKSIQVNHQWLWQALLSPAIGLKLLAGMSVRFPQLIFKAPIERNFLEQINSVNPREVVCPDELSLVQVFCALDLVDQYMNGKQTGTAYNVRWLEQTQFYQRVESILFKVHNPHNLLVRIMHTLKFEPESGYQSLAKLLSFVMAEKDKIANRALAVNGQAPESGYDTIHKLFSKTITLPNHHELWVKLWTLVLLSKIPDDNTFCTLLDSLIHSEFCINSKMFQRVLECFQMESARLANKKIITKLHSSGFIWIAYCSILVYQPSFPREITHDHLPSMQNDNQLLNSFKEARIWIWKDLAMNTKDAMLALLYWEQFFLMYFQAMSKSAATMNRVITPSLKDQLNKHFVSTAQQFTHLVGGPIGVDMKNENNKKIYTVYYAFTTWANDVIFDRFTGKIFFDLELVDEDMKGLDPSPPPMAVLISTHEPMYTVNFPKPEDSNNNAEPPKPAPSLIDLMDAPQPTAPVPAAPAKPPSNSFLVDILSKLMASLPPKVLPLSPQSIPEHSLIKSLESFQTEASSIIESLMDDSATSYSTDASGKKSKKTKLPFVNEFRNYVIEYNQLVAALKLEDEGMLSLSSQLYKNNPTTFEVTVPCRYGPACAEPALITCVGASIAPGYTDVRSDIDKNREDFTRDYNNLVALGRQFAHKIALLKYVKDFLLQHYIDRSTSINRTAYNLFYSLVALLIDDTIPSVLFHIAHSISDDANLIGMQFIANNPEPQKKFLSILLKYSSKAEKKTRIDSKTDWLKVIQCLTPIALLKNHDRTTYLQMLAKLANPEHTVPSPVLNAISNQFGANEQIKTLVSFCNDEEIDFLLQHLPNFIIKSALDDVTRDIIYSILFTSFPKNVDKVINAILNVAMTEQRNLGGAPLPSHSLHSVQWLDLLSSQIKFEMLTLENSKRLFQLLASHCPLHDNIMRYVIQIAFKMLTDIPMLMVTLYEEIQSNTSENELIHIQSSSLSPSVSTPIWDDIETFIAACLRPVSLPSDKPAQASSPSPFAMASAAPVNCYPLSASTFATVLNLLHELVDKVPSLLDKAFSCFSHVVHMYTNSLILTQMVDNIHEYRQATHNFLNQLPWHDATILQSDPLSVIKILIDLMLNGGDYVSAGILYSRLQWLHWLKVVQSNIASGNNRSYFVKTLLYFLKLSIYMHILDPDCINSNLFAVIFPPTPNSTPQDTSVQNLTVIWQFVEIGQFEEVFDGHSIIDLLKVCGSSDPSSRIVEIVFAMIEIINHLPHRAQPAASLANEIRSLLFATVANHTDSVYWHIPYQQQCALLTGCLIPIVRFASNAQQLPQLLITLLSCLNQIHFWPTPFRHGLPFVNHPEPPKGRVIFVTHPTQFFNSHYAPPTTYRQMVDSDGSDIKQFKEFSGKIHGIISQFVSSVSPQIALEIVNIGPLAIQNYEVLCEIYEETLHSLFSQVESEAMITNVLSQATACLQYPSELNRYDFMQKCSAQHCTLALRVVLEQERKRLNDIKDSSWMQSASELVSVVVKFVPNMQHYEYDIFVLWWFLLELINDDRWHVERKGVAVTDEATLSVYKYFQEYAGVVGLKNVSNMKDLRESIISIKSLLSNRTKIPAIHLGAKACLLYLDRITIQKKFKFQSAMGSNDNNITGESKDAESKRVMDQLDKLLALAKDQQFEGFATFFNEAQSLNSPQMDLKEFKLLLANHLAPIYTYLVRFA